MTTPPPSPNLLTSSPAPNIKKSQTRSEIYHLLLVNGGSTESKRENDTILVRVITDYKYGSNRLTRNEGSKVLIYRIMSVTLGIPRRPANYAEDLIVH